MKTATAENSLKSHGTLQYERIVRFISPSILGGANPLGKPLAQLPDAAHHFLERDQGRKPPYGRLLDRLKLEIRQGQVRVFG